MLTCDTNKTSSIYRTANSLHSLYHEVTSCFALPAPGGALGPAQRPRPSGFAAGVSLTPLFCSFHFLMGFMKLISGWWKLLLYTSVPFLCLLPYTAPAEDCLIRCRHHKGAQLRKRRRQSSQPSSGPVSAQLKCAAGFVSFMVMNYMMLIEANDWERSLEFLYLSFCQAEKFFTIYIWMFLSNWSNCKLLKWYTF